MGSLTLMEKDMPCEDVFQWPVFYMNDFSIMGFLVEDLGRVFHLLRDHGYEVTLHNCSAKVRFENTDHYKRIFFLMERHQIPYVSSDLVNCAYQG